MKTSMRSYLDLIPVSAKTRRKQNRLTLACIVLSVFLVTSVFSMAEIMVKGEEEAMVKKHGSHHVILSGISKEAGNEIAMQDNVSAAAWYRAFGEDIYEGYQIGDKRAILYGTEQSYVDDIRNYETEGSYPQNDNEVMLNVDAKDRLGIQMGDDIIIHTPVGDFDYMVSGFCVDERSQYDSKFDGVCAYLTVNALNEICNADPEMNGNSDGAANGMKYYVRFSQGVNLRDSIADVKARYGIADGDIDENTVTVGLAGASSNQDVNWLYMAAVAVFIMILIAGVLMISSCMNSNVSQRTKFFGIMRCVGASKKQVMRFVRLEALNWCKTAIPVGLGLGMLFTFIICFFLKNVVGGEFDEFSFRFSGIAVISGILVGVVAVLLATRSPARRAAAVSPMSAVTGNAETGEKISHAANTRWLKVESALGMYHAVSAKKNLILMSLSFAFTVTLFLVFFAGLDFARKLLPSASDLSSDISIAAVDNANSLHRDIKERIADVSGVEAVFGCAYALDTPADINGISGRVNLVSYDDYLLKWSKNSVVSGRISGLEGDCGYALTIFNADSRLNAGDKIKIGDTELEIVCVVSEGIGVSDLPSVVCTEETFRRITGEEGYILLGAQLDKDATDETVETIRALVGDGKEFVDRREENQTSNSSFWVFRMAAYGFLTIIALITVFNIMNSISMSVSARMKQYGAMRAVGMSVRQVTKMIAAEAVTYAAAGLLIGGAAGLYLHRLLTIKLIVEHFGGGWKIPFEPIMIILLIVMFSCYVAVRTPAKRIREMSVTETINEFI